MYEEQNFETFLENLKSKYKEIILNNYKKRILVSKYSPNDILIKGYKDDTSFMIYKNIIINDIVILKIPESFYNYFIGKNGIMKVKHEKLFNIQIEEIGEYKIKVEGEGKSKFKKYVLDKIYSYIF